MNKKNSLFVLIGIFLICTRFWISIGSVHIDITNDIVGYILIFIGMNLGATEEPTDFFNSRLKKGMILSVAGLISAVLSQYLISRDWPSSPETMYSIAIGISVVFAIYFTYYYTEALIMEARIQEKNAVTRNYQITWLLLSVGIFIHYFAFKASTTVYSILVEALIIVITIYYCFSVFSTSKQLYED